MNIINNDHDEVSDIDVVGYRLGLIFLFCLVQFAN